MNSSLLTQFEAIETQRRDITAQIESLSPDERLWKSSASAWSALQIAEHLILSDETVGSLGWSRRQIEIFGQAPRVHLRRQKMILWALRRNLRLPLPSPDIEPRGETPWPDLAARWQTARNELRHYLEAPDFRADARPFVHTVAGAFSASELMELDQVHTAYHARQLKRLIESQPPRAGSR